MYRGTNGTEVQAEFYRQAKNVGLTIRLEYECGIEHENAGGSRPFRTCRFDVAVFDKFTLIAIVECKRGRRKKKERETRQMLRYRKHGVPVLLVCSFPEVPDAVRQCQVLANGNHEVQR